MTTYLVAKKRAKQHQSMYAKGNPGVGAVQVSKELQDKIEEYIEAQLEILQPYRRKALE